MPSKLPDAAKLHEVALNQLARYATTEAGMARVLLRKIDRWSRLNKESAPDADIIAQAKATIPAVLARLRAANLLDDAAFAASRSRRLVREGKSRRAAIAHLAAKGVAPEAAGKAVAEDPERELAAACIYLRRRRAGPFGDMPELKILGALARAGFNREVSNRALNLDREEAEQRIKALAETS